VSSRNGRANVVEHRHRVEQGAALKEHPEPSAHLLELMVGKGREVGVADPHPAVIWAQKADEVAEQDALAGAGVPHDGEDVAVLGGEADPFQDIGVPE
jgi:hypothetical protein